MNTLSRETIIAEAAKVKPGTIARICYKTEVPVKAEFRKQGVKVVKIVETSARLGVNYHRIASVIARKAEQNVEEVIKRANNYEWIIKNKIRHNTNTDKDYLYVAAFNKGHNTKTLYNIYVNDTLVDTQSKESILGSDWTNQILPSYWNKSFNAGEVKNISFENIIRINNAGERVNFN